jgi:hydrogenase maturation protease
MAAAVKKTLVAGLGDIRFGDEGIGVHIARALKETDLPEDVEVYEGTEQTDLQDTFSDRDRIILVDAAQAEAQTAAGTMLNLLPEDFLTDEASPVLHHVDIRKTFAVLHLMGRAPKFIRIFGVVPDRRDMENELTETVKGRIPTVIEAILSELRNNRF